MASEDEDLKLKKEGTILQYHTDENPDFRLNKGSNIFQNRKLESYHSLVHRVFVVLSIVIIIIFFPFSLLVCFKIVSEYQRAVIFRLGVLRKGQARGPGVFFILPCIDEYFVVDLRVETFDIPPQDTLTKDSTSVKVDAIVYFRVFDPLKAVVEVRNYFLATQYVSATSLRNVIGTAGLIEVVKERDKLAAELRKIVDEVTDAWGVFIMRVEIKDVRLPPDMQRVMAAEAEAKRMALAKVVQAQGELNSAKALKEAADTMAESPGALQLRYLQTLTTIAKDGSTTIVFPFPIELGSVFKK